LEADLLQLPVLPRGPAIDPAKCDRGRCHRRRAADAAVLDRDLPDAVADHLLPSGHQHRLRFLRYVRHHRHHDPRRSGQSYRNAGLQGLFGRPARRQSRRLGRAVGDPDGYRHRADGDSVPFCRAQGELLMVEDEGIQRYIAHAILWIGIAIVAFPVYLAFIASTQDNAVIANGQMSLLPGGHFLETYYQTIFVGTSGSTREPVGMMMFNSLVMSLLIAIGKIAISIISAYAVVYFRFPFRMTIFWLIFITLMLPVEVRIYPTYKIVADLHLLDSYAGLTLPLIASATATLLFRQFFMTVPDELLEASRIDGAGPFRFFWDTLLPLSRTNMAALFVILFILGWNQYLWPLLVTTRDDMQTIQIGIKKMIVTSDALTEWPIVMATAVLAMLPPIFVVVVMQKLFVRGLVETEKYAMANVTLRKVRKDYPNAF